MLYKLISKRSFHFKDPIWSNVSYEAKDLILSLLKVNPTDRLNYSQIRKHPFIVKHLKVKATTPKPSPLQPKDINKANINTAPKIIGI